MPERQGKPWSADEERQLLEAFRRGLELEEIARDHHRSVAGVRTRLERLGQLPASQSPIVTSQPATAPLQPRSAESLPVEAAIDSLIDSLLSLKTSPTERKPFQRAIARVMKAYEHLNDCLIAATTAIQPDAPDDPDLDPAPDRLRAALSDAIVACVSNPKNRYVASLALGLIDDGQHVTLAQMGRDMDVTGERVIRWSLRSCQTSFGSASHY